MSTYRDPVYRSIMASSPFRFVEGTTHPVYDGYLVPVLPSPLLGGYTYMPFTPVDRGGTANYVRVNEFAKPVVGMGLFNLGATDDQSEGEALRSEIDNLYNQTVGLSQQMKQSLLSVKVGMFLDMYNNFKYRLDGLYNRAKTLLDSWNNFWTSSKGKDGTGTVDLDVMANFRDQWKDMYDQHLTMAKEVAMIVSDPKKYNDKYNDPGFFAKIQQFLEGSVKWLLIGGVVYFVVLNQSSPVHFTKFIGRKQIA